MSEGYQPNGPATNEVTPPNQGSHVYYKHPELVSRKAAMERKMNGKEIKIKLLQTIKESVDAYAESFDPCEMCEHEDKTNWDNLEVCRSCCYYYASKFEPKEAGK